MDAIAKALDEIKRTIPPQILKIVFQEKLHNWRQAPISLDEKIMRDVIRPRVLVDANIVASTEVIVPIDGLRQEHVDDFTVIIEIKPELTNNREIISCKSIGYLPYAVSYSSFGAGVGTVGPGGISDLTGAGQRMGDAMSNIPPVSEAQVDLIGPWTVVVRNFRRVTASYHLRCIVANMKNLQNIHPRSYYAFAKLCQLAVKSHIYNNMIITMDQAFLQGGQELGAVKNKIEEWIDAEEMYQTHLREVWMKVAHMNDTQSHQRFIKVQINPGL
jgi:hypothetical protein